VPSQNPDALAEGILESLSNPSETAKRVLEAKKTIFNQYDMGKWIEKIQNVYSEMKA